MIGVVIDTFRPDGTRHRLAEPCRNRDDVARYLTGRVHNVDTTDGRYSTYAPNRPKYRQIVTIRPLGLGERFPDCVPIPLPFTPSPVGDNE